MKTRGNISGLQEIAASQWGLFTTSQAQDAGISRTQINRMRNDKRVENLLVGVYRFSSGEESPFMDVKARWLQISPKELAFERAMKREPDAIVAARTAAYMHGIGDLYASPFTFIVRKRKQSRAQDVRYMLWDIEPDDIETLEGLPITKVERTIADLVRTREGSSLIDDVVRDACLKKAIDVERLGELLSPLAARNGYRKGDGKSFAHSLISHNSSLDDMLSTSFDPIMKMYAHVDGMQQRLSKIDRLLRDSGCNSSTADISREGSDEV